MGAYQDQVRDFIERTLKIIEQYEKIKTEKFEVTLLINCLMGLLVTPQQVASRSNSHQIPQDWLTGQEFNYIKTASKFNLKPKFLKNPGTSPKNESYKRETFTMRNLIRQMRNTVAHANINLLSGDSKQITHIEFKELREDDGDCFHFIIPTHNLKDFVEELADSALKALEALKNNQ